MVRYLNAVWSVLLVRMASVAVIEWVIVSKVYQLWPIAPTYIYTYKSIGVAPKSMIILLYILIITIIIHIELKYHYEYMIKLFECKILMVLS